MSDDIEIVEVTAAIELAIVDDRLHATVTSGNKKRTYALSFHKARNAAFAASALLDEAEHQRRIVQLKRGRRDHR